MTVFLNMMKPGVFLEAQLPATPIIIIGRRVNLQFALYDLLEVAYRRKINSGVFRSHVVVTEKEVKLKISQMVTQVDNETLKQNTVPLEWEKIILNYCHEIIVEHGGSFHMAFDDKGLYNWEVRLPLKATIKDHS